MTLFDKDQTIDPNKNYFEELVGEDKKFKTPADLARGKAEADIFIERLKAEQENLRKELNTRISLEQYLEKINSKDEKLDSPPPNPDSVQKEGNGVSFTPEQLEEFLNKKLSERDTKSIRDRNLAEVKETLVKAFGNDYQNKLRSVAEELSLTPEDLTETASKNPKAFYKLIGYDSNQSSQRNTLFTPPSSQQNNSFSPSVQKRDWNYYEKLRKSDPSTYWTPTVQNQMHNDAIEQQEMFFPSN